MEPLITHINRLPKALQEDALRMCSQAEIPAKAILSGDLLFLREGWVQVIEKPEAFDRDGETAFTIRVEDEDGWDRIVTGGSEELFHVARSKDRSPRL